MRFYTLSILLAASVALGFSSAPVPAVIPAAPIVVTPSPEPAISVDVKPAEQGKCKPPAEFFDGYCIIFDRLAKPSPAPTIKPTAKPEALSLAAVVDQATSCRNYSWASRGIGPRGYFDGMAREYARAVCMLKAGHPAAKIQAATSRGSELKDVLTRYGIACTSERECLRKLWTLGIGFGMRESSGKYCEGRDVAAKEKSMTGSTAEAGTFQASYNSMSFKTGGATDRLYNEFRGAPEKCGKTTWQPGVSVQGAGCTRAIVEPGSTGGKWQALTRECPAYAAQHAMTGARSFKNHWGPLNRKEAEYRSACEEMLKGVDAIVDANPESCSAI
jgi:hypothetical protein